VVEGQLVGDGAVLELGEAPQGAASSGLSMVVTNGGDAEVDLAPSIAGLIWGSAPPATLQSGESAGFSIEMNTAEVGAIEGVLTLAEMVLTVNAEVAAPLPLVVVGNDGRILVSDDYGGTFFSDTWTSGETSEEGEDVYKGICWGAGHFVVVGGTGDGLVLWSEDGLTWTEPYITTQGWVRDCAYGDHTFVLVGGSGNLAVGAGDGETWVEVHNDLESRLEAVVYGDGVFVAVGNDRRSVTVDGLSWYSDEIVEGSSLVTLTYGEGVFVAVGRSGEVATSSDQGVTWTDQVIADCTLHGVIWNGDRFFTGCKGRDILVSADGLTWNELSADSQTFPFSYQADWLWGLSGENGLLRSRDGQDWEAIKADDEGPALVDMALGGNW
jgi:hypothetical protein